MLADFGKCAHAEDLITYGTCRLVTCGCSNHLQEGDLRLKKEQCDTNVSDAFTKPLGE